MTFLLLKFIHLTSAMIYFGLPSTFGRWLSTCGDGSPNPILGKTLKKLQLYTFVHLNVTGVILMATGLWMVGLLDTWHLTWVQIAPVLMLLSFFNLNFTLGRMLKQREAALARDGGRIDLALTRKRISMFSGIHHSLLTVATLLMVFKP